MPFTAFVSGQNFRRHWIEKLSYAYFIFGSTCVSLALLLSSNTDKIITLSPAVFPIVAIGIIKRFHSQLRRPAIAIAAILLLAPVIIFAFMAYCYALHLAAGVVNIDTVFLWIMSIIFFVTGAAKAHWLIMTSRQALAQPATSLQGH
jgi:hypothetical protein